MRRPEIQILTCYGPSKKTCHAELKSLFSDAGPTRGDRPDGYTPVKISEEFILHPSVGFGNTGFYSCNASNQFTTITRDIYVEVVDGARHEKISIVGGTSQRFSVGKPAQILCTASGAALIDELKWTKNGNKLLSGLEGFNEPGLLYFENFQARFSLYVKVLSDIL